MQPTIFKEDNSQLDYLKIDNNADTAIVLFHGYGASMYDLYGIGNYLNTQNPSNWYFPNGHLDLSMGMGMMMARAWFPIDAQALEKAMQSGTFRDFENISSPEFHEAVKKCQTFIESLQAKYKKVIVGGFSQGSMITTHAVSQLDKSIAGLLCLSGTLIDKNNLISNLEKSQSFPFFQSHGKNDPILDYNAAKNLFELLKLSGNQGEFISFDGAHEIPVEVLEKLTVFINRI